MSGGQASSHWKEKAGAVAEELQKSDLSGLRLLDIMVDGVHLTRDQLVTVALGLGVDGTKKFLGYMDGFSEHSQVCMDLLYSLEERGLRIPQHQN